MDLDLNKTKKNYSNRRDPLYAHDTNFYFWNVSESFVNLKK